jgi:hypothetical protein
VKLAAAQASLLYSVLLQLGIAYETGSQKAD